MENLINEASIKFEQSKLKLKQMEQLVKIKKSINSDLTDIEFYIIINFNMVYSMKGIFILSNEQMAYYSEELDIDIENAVNHLIELKYFKIVPGVGQFSCFRCIEPAEAHSDLMIKMDA